MNDAVVLAARNSLLERPMPKSVSAFADALREIEENRGSVKLKYMVARTILTGNTYNKGASPYQEFALLIELRNALVHMETKQFSGELKFRQPSGESDSGRVTVYSNHIIKTPPGAFKKLPRKVVKGDDYNYWIERICTPELAGWACNVAIEMAKSLADSFPDGDVRETLVSISNSFEPVE